MTTVTKFTFDLDFDAPQAMNEPEPEVVEEEEDEFEEELPTYSEEEVAAARAEGFDEGKEAGRKEAADATEQKLLESMDRVAQELANVYNTQAEANSDIAREMIGVAAGIAKKMFPDLNARNALGEVERVVQETLRAITDEPRVQIFVNPDLREVFSERLGTLTNRAGFEGKVFVNPDPAIELGDCRIEWSHGAAERNTEALWEAIDEIVERNLHGAPPPADAEPADDTPAEPVETVEDEPEVEDVSEPQDADTTEAMDTPDLAPDAESAPENEVGDDPAPVETAAEPEPSMTEEPVDAEGAEPEEPPFMPHIAFPESTGDGAEPPDLNEENEMPDEPPVPHTDGMAGTGDDAESDGEDGPPPAPPLGTADPVSPDMTAAILDAQGDMAEQDDDETP